MIKLEDYRRDDGTTDWAAYRNAQKDIGEICSLCENYLVSFSLRPNTQVRRRCHDCEGITKTSELRHHSWVRCPQCGEIWDPSECEDYHLYGDGEHTAHCSDCGCDFEVITHVSYEFVSPARTETGKQP